MEGRRILVAAEDGDRLRAPVERLRSRGHLVTVLDHGAACQELDRGESFDLLIVDIEPPELSGFEVVRRFHGSAELGRPVLALSDAFKREHIEGMLENAGVQRMFPLAVTAEELLFWVNHALFPDSRRSRRSPRMPASFVLSIEGRRRTLRGRACNLSEDGLFLETNLAACKGDVLDLRFRLPGKRSRDGIAVRCEVMWSVPSPGPASGDEVPTGLGLRFLDLTDADREAIQSYVMKSLLDVAL